MDFPARVLEWGAIAFSLYYLINSLIIIKKREKIEETIYFHKNDGELILLTSLLHLLFLTINMLITKIKKLNGM